MDQDPTLDLLLNQEDYRKGSLRSQLSPILEDAFSKIEVNRILLAIEEAMVNIFEHGYRGEEGSVGLHLELLSDRLRVELRDNAPVFDCTVAPLRDPASAGEKGEDGGYGLYLLRTIMDVRHRALPDGNLLTLERSRAPGEAKDES